MSQLHRLEESSYGACKQYVHRIYHPVTISHISPSASRDFHSNCADIHNFFTLG
jgi:hypothetical protein